MASKNLTLGKGEVWFSKFATGTYNPSGYRLLGNCPEFSLNVEMEDLDHFSSMRGIKEKDGSVALGRQANGNILCDDVNHENMALFFMGTASTLTVTPAVGLTSNHDDVTQGLSYKIGETALNPTGAKNVANVVVKDDATPTPATFVLNTDYTVDATNGLVTVVVGGGIANTTNLRITYDTLASTRQTVISGENHIEGALRFIAYNPIGPKLDYIIPRCVIRANGDLNLITDEFLSIPLAIEALKKDNLSLVYLDGTGVI